MFTNKIDKNYYLIFMISASVFIPQFPSLFNRSEVHINLFILFLSIIALASYKLEIKKKELIILVFYYMSMQILLLFSYFLGSEDSGNISEILSLYRPIMLLIISLAILTLIGDIENLYLKLIGLFKALIAIIFLYSFCEVFLFEYFSKLFFLFYRMEDKANIDGIAVSFFTLPYFQAYILSIFLPILLSNYTLNKNMRSLVYILLTMISIFLTQSKMGVVVALLVIFLYMFISSGNFSKILLLIFYSILGFIITVYLVSFISFLNHEYGGNFARTTDLILAGSEHAGNLTERIKQVAETYNKILHNNIYIGVGTGKGITIESWIAHILYRYGFVGIFIFISFFIFISIRSAILISYAKKINPIKAEIGKSIFIWAIMIFLTQLSGLMMEYSKAAMFSGLMFALSARFLQESKRSLKEIKI